MDSTEVDNLLRNVEESMAHEQHSGHTAQPTQLTMNNDNVIRVRGLPWSTKEKEIRDFFSVCHHITDVHFTYSKEGRPTGEAYIEFDSPQDVELALTKHREILGQRYIEVFLSKRDEMEFVLKRSGRRTGMTSGSGRSVGSEDMNELETVVRLRGLPFGCNKEDIATFFSGLEISPDGIVFAAQSSSHGPHSSGRRAKPGEAYVRFINKETTERALDRHMNKIGHRYIEVFRSTVEEMEQMGSQPSTLIGAYGRNGSRPGPYSKMPSGPIPLASINCDDFEFGPPHGRSWNDREDVYSGRYDMAYERPVSQRRYADVGYLNDRDDWRGSGGSSPAYYQSRRSMFGNSQSEYLSDEASYEARVPSGPIGLLDLPEIAPPGPLPYSSRYGGMGQASGGGRANAHVIHMRGLPYKATANDIMEFFHPLKLVNVQILFDERSGRSSGEADVEFYTHEEATEAMTKHNQNMGGRYIELFLNSRKSPTMQHQPLMGNLRGRDSLYRSPVKQRNGAEDGMVGAHLSSGGDLLHMSSGATGTELSSGPSSLLHRTIPNPYSQSLVQYPGFGMYDYSRMSDNGIGGIPNLPSADCSATSYLDPQSLLDR